MLRRAVTTAVVAALLAWPGGAWAQTPGDDPPLTDEPPVPLDGGEPTPTPEPTTTPEPTPTPAPDGEQLANTGAEPAYTALAGLGLLLAGVGVRLRLAPHDQRLG